MDAVLEKAQPVLQRLLLAYERVTTPTVVDADHWINCGIVTGVVFLIIGLFHVIVAKRFKKVYFTCHVFVNAIVTYLVFPGTVRALLNPTTSTVANNPAIANSHMYLCWVFALHVYHPIFFRTGMMDWIHHIPVYIVTVSIFGCLYGDVFCLQTIILTGVPGGLDYLLLVFEGEGWLSRAKYKDYSAMINNWVRAPLGFLSGYICFIGLYHQLQNPDPENTATSYQIFVFVLMGIHALWNPPFFGRQAIEANVVDIINRFEMVGVAGKGTDKKKPIKLPKVRALSGKAPKNTKDASPKKTM